MKPQPPASLLPDGHEWHVIVAPDWRAMPSGRRYICVFQRGFGSQDVCGEPAVAVCAMTLLGRPSNRTDIGGEPFCDAHMGSIRWIDGDRVMQWRAIPLPGVAPVTYRARKLYPRRSRSRARAA